MEFIPMRHRRGESVHLFGQKAICTRPGDESSMFLSAIGTVYRWDYRDNTILEIMPDEGETKQNKQTDNMETITIKELEGYKNDQAIDSVEGVVVGIKPPVEPWNGKYDAPQNGFIKDDNGDEHRINFAAERVRQPMTIKGKRIRIEAVPGQHGLNGLKMKVEGEEGQWRKIHVTGTAKISFPGRNGSSGETPSVTGKKPQPAAQDGDDCVEDRLDLYFRLFEATCRRFGHDPVEVIKQLSPSDLKEMTTGQSMSWKGQYGVYAKPVFRCCGDKPCTAQSTDAGGATAISVPVDTKTGKTAAELFNADNPRYLVLLAWSLTKPSSKDDLKALQATFLQLEANSRGEGINILIENQLADDFKGEVLQASALNAYAQAHYGSDWGDLDSLQLAEIHNDYRNALTELTGLNNAPAEEADDGIPE